MSGSKLAKNALGYVAVTFDKVTAAARKTAPVDIETKGLFLLENAAVGTKVGKLDVSDIFGKGVEGNLKWEIVGGRDADRFSINPGGNVFSKVSFDYETNPEAQIRIKVTDRFGRSYEETMTVKIGDVPDTVKAVPTDIGLSSSTVVENMVAGTVVGTFSAVDADQTAGFAFAIIGGLDATSFRIESGKLLTTAAFNFEQGTTAKEVIVRVTDADGQQFVKTLTIGVTNVNEVPTSLVLNPSGTVLHSDGTGKLVATLIGTDPDAGDVLHYSLAGQDAALFAVDNLGNVTLKNTVGWNGGVARTVEATVTDSQGLALSKVYQFRADAAAPTDIDVSSLTVADGLKAGSLVLNLSALGVDATDTAKWSVSGADSDKFYVQGSSLYATVDVSLAASGAGRDIVLRATSGDGAFREEAFALQVTAAPPPAGDMLSGLRLTDYAVSEGLPGNHVVASVLTDGATAGVSLALVGGRDASHFSLVGNKLVLLNSEYSFATPDLQVSVQGTDATGHVVTQTFSVSVLAASYVSGSGTVFGFQGVPDVFIPDPFSGVMNIKGFSESDHDQVGAYFLFSQAQVSKDTVRLFGSDDLNVSVQTNDGSGWMDFAMLNDAKSKNGMLDGDGVADALTQAQLDSLTQVWIETHVIHS